MSENYNDSFKNAVNSFEELRALVKKNDQMFDQMISDLKASTKNLEAANKNMEFTLTLINGGVI